MVSIDTSRAGQTRHRRIAGQAVGNVLYIVLAGYIVLVTYELSLLRSLPLE